MGLRFISILFFFLALTLAQVGKSELVTYSLSTNSLTPELLLKIEKKFSYDLTSLSPHQIDALIQWIHLTEDPLQVSAILTTQHSLEIQIEHRSKIRSIKWITVNPEQESELRKLTKLKPGQPFDQEFIDTDLGHIKSVFLSRGHAQFTHSTQSRQISATELELEIRVHIGALTQISDIQITCQSTALKMNLQTLVSDFVKTIYKEESLLEIKQKLLDYLSDHDHVRAEIIGPKLIYSKNQDLVSIVFQVDKEDAYKFKFIGNKHFSSSRLLKALELQNFFSASSRIDSELAQRLKKFYISEAFARVEIESSEAKSKNEFERIIQFQITENPRIKINSIQLNGVFSSPADHYLAILQKVSTELIQEKFYFRDSFEASLKSFIKEIQDKGYLQAKIISFRANYDETKTSINININFDEGPQTFVQKISFTGNSRLTSDFLQKELSLTEGQAFQLSKLERSILAIKNLYLKNGYIEMSLTNELTDLVKYSEDNTQAQLLFNIFEGPQVRVAAIVLEGNEFTHNQVLLNEISLKVGDLVTPEFLEESQVNLQRTGFFGTVSVRTLEEKTMLEQRTLIVKVTERDPGLFTLGMGATNERGLTVRAYTGIAYNNLKGTGRGISLRIEGNYNLTLVKYPQSKIILGYLEPYLADTNIKGRLSLTRNEYISNYDTKQATLLNQVTFNLEKRWSQQLSAIWNLWSLSTVRDFGISPEYSLAESSINIGSFGPYIDFDYRNNPFQPTSGFITRFAYEYSDPLVGSSETINYWLATASYTHYYNVTPRSTNPVVFANQIRVGHIENVSRLPAGGVPYDKKGFVLGGRDTIRGFEAGTSESFPNRYDLESDKYVLTTLSEMFLIKSELRMPIYRELGGAVFYDGGMVYIDKRPFDDYYRDALGLGLRYNTPIGAVNLEIAFKLDKKSYESNERVHLSIGTF